MAPDSSFLQIQTQTAWGRTLAGFADWCSPRPGWRTLDVGCGPGMLPALLAECGCQAVGSDLDGDALRSGLFSPLVQADVLRLPFAPSTFDLVTATNLLFLLPDPLSALSEMRRVLRPGGRLAILNPSERMSVAAANAVADARGLSGLDRQSLLGWARHAEAGQRWDEAGMDILFKETGLEMIESVLRVGPGLARWSAASKPE